MLVQERAVPKHRSPTYQIIKVTNANHMSVMKTSLTIIPMCPRERFSLYKSLSRLVLCYKKDWAILLHFIYTCYLLPVTNYLITKLSVTYNFSACREYLAENRLSFPSAPHWVRHSYLSKGLQLITILVGHQARRQGPKAFPLPWERLSLRPGLNALSESVAPRQAQCPR